MRTVGSVGCAAGGFRRLTAATHSAFRVAVDMSPASDGSGALFKIESKFRLVRDRRNRHANHFVDRIARPCGALVGIGGGADGDVSMHRLVAAPAVGPSGHVLTQGDSVRYRGARRTLCAA